MSFSPLAAVVQFKPTKANIEDNLNRIEAICKSAASEGARLVVFPETSLSGYIFHSQAEAKACAEPKQGPAFKRLSRMAEKLGIYLVYGYIESSGEGLFNAQNLIGPAGNLLGRYQKSHLFEADLAWCHPGRSGFLSISTPLGKIGLGICMDLNYQDLIHFHKRNKTDILCLSMHWLDEGHPISPYWRMRLQGYNGTTLIANSFGVDGSTSFCGQSALFYEGCYIMGASKDKEEILFHPLSI